MSDDNKLEVCLRLSGPDNAIKRFSQASYIVPIEVGGRLVKCDELYIIRN